MSVCHLQAYLVTPLHTRAATKRVKAASKHHAASDAELIVFCIDYMHCWSVAGLHYPRKRRTPYHYMYDLNPFVGHTCVYHHTQYSLSCSHRQHRHRQLDLSHQRTNSTPQSPHQKHDGLPHALRRQVPTPSLPLNFPDHESLTKMTRQNSTPSS